MAAVFAASREAKTEVAASSAAICARAAATIRRHVQAGGFGVSLAVTTSKGQSRVELRSARQFPGAIGKLEVTLKPLEPGPDPAAESQLAVVSYEHLLKDGPYLGFHSTMLAMQSSKARQPDALVWNHAYLLRALRSPGRETTARSAFGL
jgi:hypothetical protein